MKKSLIFALGLALLAGCSRKSGPVEPNILEGSIETVSVPAPDYNMPTQTSVEAMVYLPPQYESQPNDSFPVLYLLHGFGGDHTTYQAYFDIKGIFDWMISMGYIPPMIVVMPNARNDFGGTFYANSLYGSQPVFGTYENFFVQDLVSYIDDNYRTIADADHRGLIGLSMGGYGAMRLAIKHSSLFHFAGAHSGVLDFEQFLNLPGGLTIVSLLQQENNGVFDPQVIMADPENHPLSVMAMAMAAQFSPKLGPYSAFDPAKNEFPLVPVMPDSSLWAGIRMPFDANWEILPEVWDSLWVAQNSPKALLDAYADQLSNVFFFADCGENDDLFLQLQVEPFLQKLQELGLSYDENWSGIYDHEGGYDPADLPAKHVTYFYLRLQRSLISFANFLRG